MKPSDKYYSNFAKFILIDETPKCKVAEYSYLEWTLSSQHIERISLKVLKQTLKSKCLPVYGNKQSLIDRLRTHYQRIQAAINIQRFFRGYIVRESENTRGPGYKNRSICNNETDFVTMDPLENIPRECFISYGDDKGFVYGFRLSSLMSMFKRDRRLVNPYNREDIPFDVLQSIFRLYKRIRIIYYCR